MVKSLPLFGCTAIEIVTLVGAAEGPSNPNGMKMDCPAVTEFMLKLQTGEFAASDTLDVICTYRGR